MLKPAALLFFLISLSSTTLLAGPLQDGFDAFTAGNYKTALQKWLPLAEKGNADAQYNIGILYMKGLGVDKDLRQAFNWYKRAAVGGNVDAMYNLATMYNQGKVVFRSQKDALKWWQKAADAGNDAAMFNLGVMYAYGRGVRKNTEKAITLWKKAAAKGNKDARAALYKIYSEGLFGIAVDPQQAARWK